MGEEGTGTKPAAGVNLSPLVPAKAGTQGCNEQSFRGPWIPACAGKNGGCCNASLAYDPAIHALLDPAIVFLR